MIHERKKDLKAALNAYEKGIEFLALSKEGKGFPSLPEHRRFLEEIQYRRALLSSNVDPSK